VGEQFTGERVAFIRTVVARLRGHSLAGVVDLTGLVPVQTVGEIAFRPATAGTHLIAMDSHPSLVTLPADKFHAYLHEEGLDDIVQARQAAGAAAQDGRERFRRNVKALVQVGPRHDASYAARTAQRLEIVPLRHPGQMRAGDTLPLQVLFDGRPLAGRLVKLWHKRGARTELLRATTDAQGKVAFAPSWPGAWMASVVQMVPAKDTPEADWDSFWGNLTFEIPR
jgi:hypothetical protein